jgi:hypothetical protein
MRKSLLPMLAIGVATLLGGCSSEPSAENNAANVANTADANMAAPSNMADNAMNAAESNMAAMVGDGGNDRGNPDRR